MDRARPAEQATPGHHDWSAHAGHGPAGAASGGPVPRPGLRPPLSPGRADGCPSGPPTDPHVRNSRMRFLRQSNSYLSILSSGGVVTRLASSESLSCIVPTGTLCSTSSSLQWVAWVLLPHLR